MGTTVFSTKIRKLRKEAGYTQDKVSRMLNIQRQTYSNYENALRVPPLETIVALSGIYHVTLDSLLLDQMPPISSDGSALPSPERDQRVTLFLLFSYFIPYSSKSICISFSSRFVAFLRCMYSYCCIQRYLKKLLV